MVEINDCNVIHTACLLRIYINTFTVFRTGFAEELYVPRGNIMKRTLGLVLSAVVALSLAACGSSSTETTAAAAAEETYASEEAAEEASEEAADESGKTVNTKDTIQVGFVQLLDMQDSDDAYKGIEEAIDEASLSDKIIIDRQSASGDAPTMSTIIQGFVDNDYDLIVPILTPPTQAAVSICGGETPIIFASVVDPVYSKIMPDWNTVDPANLATGTSNTIPADLIIETANKITPVEDGKKICIMYNTSQNNAECTMEAAKAYCEEKGYDYDVVGYADVTDAVTQAQGLSKDDYAYVYVALDSVIAASFNQLGQALTELGIPVYGAADAMTKGGAFCSYGVDYDTVGRMTGEMIVDWYNGKALEDMPCSRYSDFTLVINEDVQKALGIELPEDLASEATYVNTVAK